jgi:hypothetical protein
VRLIPDCRSAVIGSTLDARRAAAQAMPPPSARPTPTSPIVSRRIIEITRPD